MRGPYIAMLLPICLCLSICSLVGDDALTNTRMHVSQVVGYLLRRSVVQRHAVTIKANVCKMRHMQVSNDVQLLGTQRVIVTRQTVCAKTGKSIGVKPFRVLADLSLQLLQD